MKEKTVLVIGGGAAGLAAAISAASQGANVALIEKMDRVGKKILATGNGRCNMYNTQPPGYLGGADFAGRVLSKVGVKEVRSFFEGLGLSIREEEEGRAYPASGQAASVLDVLRLGCARHGVDMVCGAAADRVQKTPGGWKVWAGGREFAGDSLIVTGGGKAYPKLGSDGSTYALLVSQGHHLTALKPALVPLKTELEPIRGLEGIRMKAEVWLTKQENELSRKKGEILFTAYGVSGVAAMQLARESKGAVLHLSFLPAINENSGESYAWLMRRKELLKSEPLEHFFLGALASRLGLTLLKRAGLGPMSRLCETLTDREVVALSALMEDFPLTVTGVQGFDQAQVTAGGIDLKEFDPERMASLLAPKLYAAGEVLDVDGDCGGFNLLFAWASGILAGIHAAGEA